MQNNDLARAKEYFNQALKIDPSNTAAMFNLGVVHEREGNKAEAEAMYRKVLKTEKPAKEKGKEPEPDPMREVARESLNNLKAGGKSAKEK